MECTRGDRETNNVQASLSAVYAAGQFPYGGNIADGGGVGGGGGREFSIFGPVLSVCIIPVR